jgi:hypothetical protein
MGTRSTLNWDVSRKIRDKKAQQKLYSAVLFIIFKAKLIAHMQQVYPIAYILRVGFA